jgi:phasin
MRSKYSWSKAAYKDGAGRIADPIGIKLNRQGKRHMDPFKTPNFEVPNEMRDFANKSMEQARRAFDSFLGATQQAAGQAQNATQAMQKQAEDASKQVVGFAEQNVKAAFDHAQSLMQAKGLEDVMKLQSGYLKDQIAAMQDQLKAMGTAVQNAAKPKK